MAIPKQFFEIFRKGSTSYFYSSLLFPKNVREDIFTLYAFVRTVDNFVDTIPQQKKQFHDFLNEYNKARLRGKSSNLVINEFIKLLNRKKIPKIWVDEFIDAMKKDLYKKKYKNIDETISYVNGSAEVIGLMMCKILGISKKGYPYARLLGRSMQYINFIRDIKEDLELERNYFPQNQLKKYKLKNLTFETSLNQYEEFTQFIHEEIKRYYYWQNKAEQGFKYIPKKYLLPIKTASDLYKWTAETIYKNPSIVYNKKVKPSVSTIIIQTGRNIF